MTLHQAVPVAVPTTPPISFVNCVPIGIHNRAQSAFDHARRCKDHPDECHVCKGNMAFFAEQLPYIISKLMENPLKQHLKQRLGVLVFQRSRERYVHRSVRAVDDWHATARLFAYHKLHFPNAYPKKG